MNFTGTEDVNENHTLCTTGQMHSKSSFTDTEKEKNVKGGQKCGFEICIWIVIATQMGVLHNDSQ